MKCVRELKRELPLLYKRGKIESRDITYIFSKVREILEHRSKYKTDHPILNLFCNWCAHSKLSSSNTIYRILLKISESLSRAIHVKDDENPSDMTKLFLKVSSKLLDISSLRLGLEIVLKEQGIDSLISQNDKWWDACMSMLLNEISEKPISFPEKILDGSCVTGKSYDIFQQIMSITDIDDKGKVISLSINLEKNSPLFEGRDGFAFHFKTMFGVTYVTPVSG